MLEMPKLFPASSRAVHSLAASRLTSVSAVIAFSLIATACSSLPDSLNPEKWYEGADAAVNPPSDPVADYGKDQPYPNLSTVPPRPAAAPPVERTAVANGLVADRTNAAYTEDTIRHEVDPATPLPAPSYAQTTAAPKVADAGLAAGQPGATVVGQTAVQPQGYYQTDGAPVPTGYVNTNSNLLTGAAPSATAATAAQSAPRDIPVRPTQGDPGVPPPAPAGVPNQATQLASLPPYSPVPSVPAQTGYGNNSSAQIATIYFGSGAAVLGNDDKAVLRQVADLVRLQGGRLRVTGHASTGSATPSIKESVNNLRVSGERADVVTNELVHQGVPSASITQNAETGVEASLDPRSDEGKAAGRRVDIFLDY